jgi:hypothetical protein
MCSPERLDRVLARIRHLADTALTPEPDEEAIAAARRYLEEIM